MLDHVILTVSNLERSVAFYTIALKSLGITDIVDYKGQREHPNLIGFGQGHSIFFWLKEGKSDPQAVHARFVAQDQAEVDAFYEAAISAGAKQRKLPEYSPNTIPAIIPHGCWIPMGMI